MNTPRWLTLQWSFAGIFLGTIFGTTAYSRGFEYMKEPPPYVMMATCVIVSVYFAAHWAYGAGLKEGAAQAANEVSAEEESP